MEQSHVLLLHSPYGKVMQLWAQTGASVENGRDYNSLLSANWHCWAHFLLPTSHGTCMFFWMGHSSPRVMLNE